MAYVIGPSAAAASSNRRTLSVVKARVHIYAALAEKECRNISFSTKQALAAARAVGVKLGNPKQAKANKREADRYARELRPILNEFATCLS